MRLDTSNNSTSDWKGKKVDANRSEEATSRLAPDTSHRVRNVSDQLEVPSKDGYRTTKGKSKAWEINASSKVSGVSVSCSDEQADRRQRPPPVPDKLDSSFDEKWVCNICTLLNSQHSMLCVVCESERPDDEVKEPHHGGKQKQKKKTSKSQRVILADFSASESSQNSSGGSVWGNGGGKRLVSMVQKSPDSYSKI